MAFGEGYCETEASAALAMLRMFELEGTLIGPVGRAGRTDTGSSGGGTAPPDDPHGDGGDGGGDDDDVRLTPKMFEFLRQRHRAVQEDEARRAALDARFEVRG